MLLIKCEPVILYVKMTFDEIFIRINFTLLLFTLIILKYKILQLVKDFKVKNLAYNPNYIKWVSNQNNL